MFEWPVSRAERNARRDWRKALRHKPCIAEDGPFLTELQQMTLIVRITLLLALGLAGSVAAQDAAKLDKGKQVYTAQKCQACHSVAGVGNKKGALDEVGAKLKEDEIRQWIVAAPDMAAKAKSDRKPPMKAYPTLPKEDLDALVAYLAALKKK
jgi:mono/diheme cytochrome c family protein